MAFHDVRSPRSLYRNPERAEWSARIANYRAVDECTAALRQFREEHIGPHRTSYALYNDSLWVQNELEQRLSQLKCTEMSDDELLAGCTTGELASDVAARWLAQVEGACTRDELEQIAVYFRRMYKPPIMPVNIWLKTERELVTKLMTTRGERRQATMSLEELRKQRGVTVITGAAPNVHTITARFQGGEEIQFECREDEDIISAGLREQIILMSQCRSGKCATCKAHCPAGDYRFGEGVNVYSLPSEEQDDGIILGCQTFPRSDLVVEMPYDREMVSFGASSPERELLGRVQSFERVTQGVYRLVIEHLNPETKRARELSFMPGQYMSIEAPGTGEWRSFSVATSPSPSGVLEFFIQDHPGAMFASHFIKGVIAGRECKMRGPYGMFHVNRHSDRARLFVAVGTGIAPVLSMLRHMRDSGDAILAKVILAVDKANADLCKDELHELASALPQLAVERCVGDGADSEAWREQLVGSVGAAISDGFADSDVYVCGHGTLVDTVEAASLDAGVGGRQIFVERFLQSDASAKSGNPASRGAG